MATAGPNFGSSFAMVSGIWNNLTNLGATDGVFATINNPPGGFGVSKATGFGFAVPNGATINGITVTATQKIAAAGNNDTWAAQLTKDGTNGVGSTLTGSALSTSLTAQTVGGASNLWGTTWTAAEVNAATFGLLLTETNGSGGGNGSVDSVTITIDYTVAGATVSVARSLLGVG